MSLLDLRFTSHLVMLQVTFESNNEKATISFDLSDELAKNKQFSLWLKDPSVG